MRYSAAENIGDRYNICYAKYYFISSCLEQAFQMTDFLNFEFFFKNIASFSLFLLFSQFLYFHWGNKMDL